MHQLLPSTFYENMLYQHHRVVSCPVRSDNSNNNNVLSSYSLFVYMYVCTVHDKEMAWHSDRFSICRRAIYSRPPRLQRPEMAYYNPPRNNPTTTDRTDLSGSHTVATWQQQTSPQNDLMYSTLHYPAQQNHQHHHQQQNGRSN